MPIIRDTPDFNADCDPLTTMVGMCDGNPMTEPTPGFAGAALPNVRGPAPLIIATTTSRALQRVWVTPGMPTTFTATPLLLPVCATNAPVLAIVARDIDGDHELDLIAIDGDLHVLTAFTGGAGGFDVVDPVFVETTPILGPAINYQAVRTSTTGVPL
jgi:hypothetical protein